MFFSSLLVTRFYTLIGTQNHICIYDMEVKVKQSRVTKGTIGQGGVRTGKMVVTGRKTLIIWYILAWKHLKMQVLVAYSSGTFNFNLTRGLISFSESASSALKCEWQDVSRACYKDVGDMFANSLLTVRLYAKVSCCSHYYLVVNSNIKQPT